jgi:hypothetical protein
MEFRQRFQLWLCVESAAWAFLWEMRERGMDGTKVDTLCCVGLDESISTITLVRPVANMELVP